MKTRLALTLLTVAIGWAVPAASPQPAYPVVTPGARIPLPARSWRASCLSHRMVVFHRLA